MNKNIDDDNSFKKWKAKNSAISNYAHFDKKTSLNHNWDYITNPANIKKHGFYPFISYEQFFCKAHDDNGKICINIKTRPLCYSSHIDKCIYKYYSYLLNIEYNKYLIEKDLSNNAIAYRTNLHKNNIHFAKEAFDFIKQEDCFVVIGDFKSFFDNLEHKYLKNMLCKVLDVDVLPDDLYAIYKNITKYSTWDLIDILNLNGVSITKNEIDEAKQKAQNNNTRLLRHLIREITHHISILNGCEIEDYNMRCKKLALTKEEFKKHKKEYLKKNTFSYGIPQGSPISAVLSNVYMIEFDKYLNNFVNKYNGLYLRYSDDFIVVIPKSSNLCLSEIYKSIKYYIKQIPNLTLEPNKTQLYTYKNNIIIPEITNCDEHICQNKPFINYLGFTFDGTDVTIRAKTISKYYYRMYRCLDKGNMHSKKNNYTNSKYIYKRLYENYTQKGRNGKGSKSNKKNIGYKNSNFISYVYKSDKIFNFENNKKEPIHKHTNRHMLKIRRSIIKNKKGINYL